jgi:type II secretory ATPase GspE/PulE/Tfp pilus assembly ATPase PilB-like protein
MIAVRNIVAKHRTMPAEDAAGSEQSAPQVLERLVAQAERAGASDIHLHMREGAASIAFRLDGVMTPTPDLPATIAERVFGRIKFLARLKTYQESLPQDGRIDKAALSAHTDIRVATYPTVTGEKIVLRLFDNAGIQTLNELGFAAEARAELERFLGQTAGLLLLTGPAGSGKTTTIYACLRRLAEQGGRHIITVEDPAEQIVPGIMQTEVNEARGLDFAKAARHLLRQDPQVLVIGEIRDDETANIAVRAALTGHLVISTLHAGSCQGVFERLLVLCTDHSAVASSLELVLNQRLLRRRCAECSGKGCPACLATGYRGRLPLVEWLRLNDSLRRRIAARDLDGLAARPALAESAQALVRSGLTTETEVARVLGFSGATP